MRGDNGMGTPEYNEHRISVIETRLEAFDKSMDDLHEWKRWMNGMLTTTDKNLTLLQQEMLALKDSISRDFEDMKHFVSTSLKAIKDNSFSIKTVVSLTVSIITIIGSTLTISAFLYNYVIHK